MTGDERAALAFLLVAEDLRGHGWLSEAVIVLEEARLICGESSDASVRLAYVRAEMGEPLVAARLFELAATQSPPLALAASEQYRMADRLWDALRMGARVEGEIERHGQLAAIYLQADSFDAALEILRPLAIKDQLNDQSLFRMAYAAFRTGRYDLADDLLRKVASTTTLAEPRGQLMKALKACRSRPWSCW